MKKAAVILLSLIFLISLTSICFGASVGSVTHTIDDKYKGGPSGVRMVRHLFTMVSSTNGVSYDTGETVTLSGKIRLMYVDHDSSVTDDLDIVLFDADGKDWLYGEGLNFDSTNTALDNQRYPVTSVTGATIYMPNIDVYTSGSGFGSEKTVYFYIIEE